MSSKDRAWKVDVADDGSVSVRHSRGVARFRVGETYAGCRAETEGKRVEVLGVFDDGRIVNVKHVTGLGRTSALSLSSFVSRYVPFVSEPCAERRNPRIDDDTFNAIVDAVLAELRKRSTAQSRLFTYEAAQ